MQQWMRSYTLLLLPPSSGESKHWSSNCSKVDGVYRHNEVGQFDLERVTDNIPETIYLNWELYWPTVAGIWRHICMKGWASALSPLALFTRSISSILRRKSCQYHSLVYVFTILYLCFINIIIIILILTVVPPLELSLSRPGFSFPLYVSLLQQVWPCSGTLPCKQQLIAV